MFNQPNRAREHFYGLREAKKDLVGFALFDRVEQELQKTAELKEYKWKRREIENYLAQPETLLAYAEGSAEEVAPRSAVHGCRTREKARCYEGVHR